MKQIKEFMSGKKTYTVVSIIIGLGCVVLLQLCQEIPTAVYAILTAVAIACLRAGVGKK